MWFDFLRCKAVKLNKSSTFGKLGLKPNILLVLFPGHQYKILVIIVNAKMSLTT
jgi:hypothetical protein